MKRESGQPEGFCASILAQVAEMLVQAMVNSLELCQSEWSDQEAFVLSIHGTQLKLTAAWFPKEYLQAVHSPTMPVDQTLWVRRSKPYDLKDPYQRVQALMVYIALSRIYIAVRVA